MENIRLKLNWFKFNVFLPNIQSFKWLYAPKKEAIFFSLRTIIASFLALAISLWMEMDSPKWAVMTVWIISQTSRGETITKSKWRIVGTIVGVVVSVLIVAAFPQQPFLFEICLACWIGGCCFFASLIRSSSSYSVVLAGYTCTIIAFTASSDPENVFMLAMSRGTYIILAVLCQDLVERIFAYNQEKQARSNIEKNMLMAITGALNVIKDVFNGDYQAVYRVRETFSAIAATRNTLEFRKAEMTGNDHMIDHVHATLFSVVIVLTRLMNLVLYMREFKEAGNDFHSIFSQVHTYVQSLIQFINKNMDFRAHMQKLADLRWECRQIIANHIFHDTALNCSDRESIEKQSFLHQRILYRALSELLGELEVVLREYRMVHNPPLHDRFTFRMPPLLNFRLAWSNGLRVFLVVILCCLIWEVTAWPNFTNALGFSCMICGRLCLFENSYKFSLDFLKGTVLAMIVSGIMNVTLIASANTIELLCIAFFIPAFIGGLAIYNLPTRGIGMSFTIFLSLMLVVDNQDKMNELTFFNTAFATVAVAAIAIFSFRYIAPYSPIQVRKSIRQRMIKDIHTLPVLLTIPPARKWLAVTTDWFVSLMRQFDPAKELTLIRRYNQGALAVMVIGINIIEMRKMIIHDILPEDVKNQLRVVIRRISHFKGGHHVRTVLIIKSAIRRLQYRESHEKNLAQRLEIGTAIACLIPIHYALEKNLTFFNLSYSDN
ncbi:MAG: FUSC family protein [Commensalibacter sp.]|nr:FUSC family protein [Commensalibacter sp.]